MNWYPKRDDDWYPHKPTVGQVAFGAASFLALAGFALYLTAMEPSTENRAFLWVMAGLLLVLATWRIAIGVRISREHRRARRGP